MAYAGLCLCVVDVVIWLIVCDYLAEGGCCVLLACDKARRESAENPRYLERVFAHGTKT
jgi:hypothetical protein